MTDLLPRVVTAIILIPLVLLGLFFLPPDYFALASGVVFLIAGWEWSRLSGLQKNNARILYCCLILLCLIASFYVPLLSVLISSIVFWFFAVVILFVYSRRYSHDSLRHSRASGNPAVFIQFSGFIMLPACWKAINYLCFLYPHPYKLLSLFLIVWLADIAAYFVGSRFGKHKLALSISPGKSIEGVIGGLVIVGIVIALIFHSISMIFLALVTVIISIIGDLFESFMKRRQGLKDSGNILPGHGGILDRIDSLISAAPFFALGLMYFH